ncbi:MAG TPA: TolC family protein [Vicinamibacterales bacterium]|nr:TolC family protein [Vicinamibacterales bacterium]
MRIRRRTRLVRCCGAVAAAVTLSVSAAAQERVTLDEAIVRGLQHSARLAELAAREAAAAASADGRRAAGRPVVSLAGGYTRTNHVDEFTIAVPGQPPRVLYPDIPDNFRSRVDLQWPIYTAGRVDALERAARAEATAAREDLAAARADLRLEITRAFWALVIAGDTERVLERSMANLDAHLADLRARLEQGLIPPHEVLSAEAHRARQRVVSLEASNTRRIAEADLRRLIGGDGPLAPEGGLAPIFAPDEKTGPDPISRNALQEAELGRSEKRALEARLAAARERVTAADAQVKPQIAVAAGYDYARPNPRIFPRADRWDDSWDASVHVAWTLWDGGRRRAERAEATAAARALEARITEFDRHAAFDVHARALEVQASRAAIAAADDGIRSAEEALRVVRERYRAGVATSTDVLDAETAVLHAHLDRTRAVAALRLGEARLARARGTS